MNTPARSETVLSKKDSFPAIPAESWPSLSDSKESNTETTLPQSPQPLLNTSSQSSLEDMNTSELGKNGKKWSKLPVQIRYTNAAANKNNRSQPKSSRSRHSSDRSVLTEPSKQKESPIDSHSKPAAPRSKHHSSSASPTTRSSSIVSSTHSPTQSNNEQQQETNYTNSSRPSYKKSFHRRDHHNYNGVSMNRSAKSYGRDNYNSGSSYYYSYYQPYATHDLDMVKFWLRSQLEYYYSVENLCRDMYFRKQMSLENGGVSLSVISNFNRVRSLLDLAKPFYSPQESHLSSAAQYKVWLLDILRSAIQESLSIEVIEDRGHSFVRLKQDWSYWLLPQDSPTLHANLLVKTDSNASVTPVEASLLFTNPGNGNEETLPGQKVSSDHTNNMPNGYPIQQVETRKNNQVRWMPSPPISPLMKKLDNELFSSSDLSPIRLIMTHSPELIDLDSIQELESALRSFEQKNNSIVPADYQSIPRVFEATKLTPFIGWFYDSDQTSYESFKQIELFKDNDLVAYDYDVFLAKAMQGRVFFFFYSLSNHSSCYDRTQSKTFF